MGYHWCTALLVRLCAYVRANKDTVLDNVVAYHSVVSAPPEKLVDCLWPNWAYTRHTSYLIDGSLAGDIVRSTGGVVCRMTLVPGLNIA